jgi:uncharacterized protein (DUF2147 family)
MNAPARAPRRTKKCRIFQANPPHSPCGEKALTDPVQSGLTTARTRVAHRLPNVATTMMSSALKAALAGLFATALACGAARAGGAAGTWTSEDGGLKVELSDCGGNLCGHVVWLGEPIDRRTGKPKTDAHNPDPAKRTRPLIGLEVATMTPTGRDRWSGTIYNAEDGHVYRANLRIKDAQTAVLEGCMLVVLCRGHTWRRAR